MRRCFYLECTRPRFCIALGGFDFTLESAMSAESRLYLRNPSSRSVRAVRYFGRPSEPKVGLVQTIEFIKYPEWTYAR